MAGVADHMVLTGANAVEVKDPFLDEGRGVGGGTWITMEVVYFAICSHGRRARALLTAMPVAKCTASAMAL